MIKKILFAAALGVMSSLVQAEIRPIQSPTLSAPNATPEVIEFFSFGCPHCFDFEPTLNQWKAKNQNVKFKRVAVGFNRAWLPLQRLYFTYETMNVPESRYSEVFNAVHVNKENLYTDEKVIEWVSKKGLDKRQFTDMYNSFTVQAKVRTAENLINAYNIESVPSMAVNGRNVVYTGKGGFPELLGHVDSLLKVK